jgi:hypothetical protein
MMTHDNTITLLTFHNMMEATTAQDKLNTSGIESFLEIENIPGLAPSGGVVLKIFSKDKARAEKITAE